MKQKMKDRVRRVQDKINKAETIPSSAEWKLDTVENKLDKQIRFENDNAKGTLERIQFSFWKAFRDTDDALDSWESIFFNAGFFGGYVLLSIAFFTVDFWLGLVMWIVLTFLFAGIFHEARQEEDN